ncbi:hypothetical protein TIFTF001_023468 [Ficus carica]|uniref:Uncharacterized protein n=1 Tax=Ficus carica TaxID=3494 RepID=A0AA88AET2_FICCA|nr:hypothetical protein TIFTF001_023468 [Ficus carica]
MVGPRQRWGWGGGAVDWEETEGKREGDPRRGGAGGGGRSGEGDLGWGGYRRGWGREADRGGCHGPGSRGPGVGRRCPSLAAGRSPVMEKTWGEKGNMRRSLHDELQWYECRHGASLVSGGRQDELDHAFVISHAAIALRHEQASPQQSMTRFGDIADIV